METQSSLHFDQTGTKRQVSPPREPQERILTTTDPESSCDVRPSVLVQRVIEVNGVDLDKTCIINTRTTVVEVCEESVRMSS